MQRLIYRANDLDFPRLDFTYINYGLFTRPRVDLYHIPRNIDIS